MIKIAIDGDGDERGAVDAADALCEMLCGGQGWNGVVEWADGKKTTYKGQAGERTFHIEVKA